MLVSKSKKQANTKKKNTHKITEPKKSESIKYLIIAATCALLFFPAFFRGLFFERELRVIHIATFMLAIIWFAYNYKDKGSRVLRYNYEYFLFAAVVMYILNVPFAASRRLALLEALKYVNYLAVYILVRDSVIEDKKAIMVFMNAILASVCCMSVIGLMNYIGLMDTHGALVNGRISSTLQYPNTLAAVIGAAVFICLYLAAVSESFKIQAAYTVVLNILLTTFVLTFSRTMYVMFPPLMIAFLALVPSRLRGSLFRIITATAVPSLVTVILLMKYNDKNSSVTMIILLVSALMCVALLQIAQRLNRFFALTKLSKYIVAGTLLIAVATGIVLISVDQPLELSHYNTEDGNISRNKTVYSVEGEGDYLLVLDATAKQSEEKSWIGRVAINSVDKTYSSNRIKNYYIREETDGLIEIPFSTDSDTYYITIGFYNYYNNTSFVINNAEIINQANGERLATLRLDYKYLPRNLISRIESLNIKTSSFQGRIAFFRDAFRMIKDNFLIGLGGGAWQAAYMKYRSYEYWTTQTHSYPIQVWMEIGTIGFLLVLGFTLLYTANIVKAYKSMDDDMEKMRLTAAAAFIMGILLHSLVDFDLSLGAVSIMLWASFALATVHFKGEDRRMDKGTVLVKPAFMVALCLLLAVTACMWTAEYFNRKTAEVFSDKRYEEAVKSARTAVKLDPYNPIYRVNLANVINSTDMDRAEKYMLVSEQLEAAIKHDPFDSKTYGQMALHQFYSGRFEDAIGYLDTAISYNPTMPASYINKMEFMYNIAKYYHEHRDETEAADALNRLMGIKDEITYKNKDLMLPIETDPRILAYYFKANFALDYIDERDIFDEAESIVMYEHFTFDTDGDMLPDLWQIPYQDDKEIEGRIGEEEGDGVFTITSDSQSFYIQRMDMGLKPSSQYILIIDGYSKSPKGKLRVMIRSSSGTSEQFTDGYFAFNEEGKVYQTKFETTDDITEGDQYIRLYFNDIDDEVVLKRIIIIKND